MQVKIQGEAMQVTTDDFTYPKGVGGWLAFLIFVLVIFGLSSFGEFSNLKEMAVNKYPDFARSPEWQTYMTFMWWYLSAELALRIGAVYCLVAIKRWSSVIFTLWVLCLIGPINLILNSVIANIIFYPLPFVQFEKILGQLVASIIGSTVWTAYLLRSKRVRNTYPR
jgi:hypothetical protein